MKIIISVALTMLLFVGCGEEKSKPVEAVVKPVRTSTTAQKIDKVVESASKSTQEVSVSVKEMSDTTVEKTKEIVASAQVATNDAVKATKEVAEVVANKIDEVLTPTNEAGKELYKACASCHGQNAEKPALGKSKVIKGWSVSKIEHALNGYVDGSYGGAMKAIMKGQAARLTADETKAVAEYISGL